VQDVAGIAGLLADGSRIAMLDLLLDGGEHPVTELAAAAGVAVSTASGHLTRLADARLVAARRDGRRRLYALGDPSVARALEALGALARPTRPNGLRSWTRMEQLRAARTCYDHLAGRLGVAVADAAQAAGALTPELGLGPEAPEWFAALGVDLDGIRRGRRPLLRTCVDWTERRGHLAGALGAAVCASLLERDWVRRRPGTRAVAVTPVGLRRLDELGVRQVATPDAKSA
jgi:DNA-binding transcriptional ArsR family regulator